MKLQFLFPVRTQQNTLEAIGELILRVFAGLAMAFAHGLGKLPPPDGLIDGVAGMGFPAPVLFAWSASLAEFAGGILLALGLITRPSAFFLGFTMLIAAFVAHADDPFQKKEMALLYLAISTYFMLAGSGKFSLDTKISKILKPN